MISFKLPSLDDNPILLAETRTHKINEFIQKLPFGDPISAANDLVDELQILNTQKVAFSNRLNALELYRPAAIQIYKDLILHFSNASLPLTKNERIFADVAMKLWQEFAYGYKLALIDLLNKILAINSSKSAAQVIQRAIHAFKEIILIHHLCYRTPSSSVWAELHKLYFSALQQSVQKLSVIDQLAMNNVSSVNLIYTQILLMELADPQHLASTDILKTDIYLSNIAENAEIRPLGLIDNPTGVFIIALDGDKPPIPVVKNKEKANEETDILLITVNLARQIHQHMKLLQDGIVPNDGYLPSHALENQYQDLLAQLIKNFGKAQQRIFSRTKKSDGVELGIGLITAHHLVKSGKSKAKHDNVEGTIKPSRWQILNVGAGGYALRKFSSSAASARVGDIVAMKNSKSATWELAVLRWANINEMNQLDVGVELISPSAVADIGKVENVSIPIEGEVLLLPEVSALKQSASIIAARGFCKLGNVLSFTKHQSILVNKIVERTARFERFEYSLI